MNKIAIWWIRRDVRLADNLALHKALGHAKKVIPLFILDPALLNSGWNSAMRTAFLIEGLRLLDADLRSRGNRLLVRTGRPEEVVAQVVQESSATAVYAQADLSPYATRRDTAVAQVAPLVLLAGLTIHPPEMVLKADGTPYTIFTPFSKVWKQMQPPTCHDLLPVPEHIPSWAGLQSDSLPEARPLTAPFLPGEVEAQKRLSDFVHGEDAGILGYGNGRNQLNLNGTSKLSPYLRFGMISARQAMVTAMKAMTTTHFPERRHGTEAWLNELIWRDFYIAILYHFPHVRSGSFRAQYDNICWRNNHQEFASWCAGKTGYPVVDAAMRQLLATGWMHNRARMITASFLVKDLLIDWSWGETWFMQHLVDGDPAANNGGWQWSAGTGTDAAPYFRVFNPTTQSRKFDPYGETIRRWLPELANVPDKYIHEPQKMDMAVQQKANCIIGQDYPAPIVDHKLARKRTLEAYKMFKENETPR